MEIEIDKIITAAKAGGAVQKKYFGQSIETIQKTIASDFQTKADLESEQAILEILKKDFPEFNIISEEIGEINNNSDYTFYIDPLDGTNNFVIGLPNFSVSIGLFYKEEIIAGVIYSPIIDRVYYAQKGGGAFINNEKINVNKETDIKRATIAYNCNYDTGFEEQVKITDSLYSKDAKRILFNWSPTYDFCMLASGKIEGIINNNNEIYDFAAGKLIAREAGAIISNFDGTPEQSDRNAGFIICNNASIQNELIQVLI